MSPSDIAAVKERARAYVDEAIEAQRALGFTAPVSEEVQERATAEVVKITERLVEARKRQVDGAQ